MWGRRRLRILHCTTASGHIVNKCSIIRKYLELGVFEGDFPHGFARSLGRGRKRGRKVDDIHRTAVSLLFRVVLAYHCDSDYTLFNVGIWRSLVMGEVDASSLGLVDLVQGCTCARLPHRTGLRSKCCTSWTNDAAQSLWRR
jgi:hypothetical protein